MIFNSNTVHLPLFAQLVKSYLSVSMSVCLSPVCVCVCVCVSVKQNNANHNCYATKLVCTDLLINPDHKPRLLGL